VLLEFQGCKAKIVAIRRGGKFVESVAPGERSGLLLDQTSFYAEQGGQIFDTGYILLGGQEDKGEFTVTDVQVTLFTDTSDFVVRH